MRIGFLFNQLQQVAHGLPIAMALARGGFAGDIVVATTSPRIAAAVRRLGEPLLGGSIEHVELGLRPGSARLARMLGHFVPTSRLVYGDNLGFFGGLDVLVATDASVLTLRRHHHLRRPLLVQAQDHAGGRSRDFTRGSAGFDHVLCAGQRVRDRLVGEAGVPAERISIVGYPKFDIANPCPELPWKHPPQPVVLYNPHPAPQLSSWYQHGRVVLDFFAAHSDYKLIFAPHVALFERRFVLTRERWRIDRPGELDARYRCSPSIHMDLGSEASADMSYTLAADIYLGDASGQAYEFLYRPRPCLFLNSHRRSWQADRDYEHWRAGPVIETPGALEAGLERALEDHATQYLPVQRELRAHSFDLTERPSGERAAEAVLRFTLGQAAALPLRGALAA